MQTKNPFWPRPKRAFVIKKVVAELNQLELFIQVRDCVHGVNSCHQLLTDYPFRKEVIQPQVPLRLPCYDLVPIIELTFGAILTRLDLRLRAPPTFVA